MRVRTLGRFELWRGKTLEQTWKREKALELFQYFITYHHTLNAKERIVEDLWPSLLPAQADRDFKVALNALNAVLDPNRPPRSIAASLLRQGSSYGLNDQYPLEIDYLSFEKGILEASALPKELATKVYRKTLETYQGDYLPERAASDWTAATRERLQSLYLSGASNLAKGLLESKNYVEASDWAKKVIALDPCWEEAYRILMQTHLGQGNRPLAIKTFKKLIAVLKQELNLKPMQETLAIYEQLK